MLKIWRTPFSAFGVSSRRQNDLEDETIHAVDAYTDDVLANIAAAGFNGIWVHGLLHHLVSTPDFPEFGPHAAVHQQKMNQLIERAAGHGVRVYIYMQPPRAIPVEEEAFWRRHSDIGGQEEELNGDTSEVFKVRALCTSTPQVKQYLRQASSALARALPGLGGVILITASEYPAHCYSRRGRILGAAGEVIESALECPRCAARSAPEVIAEVIKLVRDGIREATQSMDVIAWNWSWTFFAPSPCLEIINRLPQDVSVMADFERGGWRITPDNRRQWIDEYSIGFAGPSEQFTATLAATRRRGLTMLAKLQFGTTHELATMPNLPALGNLFIKADFIRRNKLAGFMGCWNFGNMLTANSAGFNYFLSAGAPETQLPALEAFAALYFPGCRPDLVREAWLKFGAALEYYPFSIPYLYMGPTNYALGYLSHPAPLEGKSAGRSWLNDERGDELQECLCGFTIGEITRDLDRLAAIWRDGVTLLRQGLNCLDHCHAREELANAAVCAAVFQSTANLFRFYKLRRHWREELRKDYRSIAEAELKLLREALPYLEEDRRLGFHSEAHVYMFDAAKIRSKIQAIEVQLETL